MKHADEIEQGPPRATLRLQFNRDFPFEAALERLPYFARLGVSHLYASPILTARVGSVHGYDVVDHGAVNPELGGEDGLRRLVAGLRSLGLGLIVDIVPNHMAVGNHDNAWWLDVLQWGRGSRYASFFDIDWDVPDPALSGRLLAPFLGQPYGVALAAGEILLRFDATSGRFYAAYFDHHFPIRPENYATLLAAAGPALADQAARFGGFRGGRGARGEDFAAACAALAAATREPAAAAAMQRLLELYKDEDGQRRLHRLLEQQHYRLAWWRTAVDEINWRRFFDVIDLAGLRVQEHAVFEAVHATSLRLYEEGLIDGFRVDHVDGLADPRQYCRRLRQRLRKLTPRRPPGLHGHPYLIVEKILAPGEVLALDWQVDGSSGYAFMNEAGALLHDARGEAELRRIWSLHSGRSGDFPAEERAARRRSAQDLLAADFHACAHALHQIARRQPATRDWTLEAVERVLIEMLVQFPVYRCYVDARGRSAADASIMAEVCAGARGSCRPGEGPLLDLVDGWLGGMPPLQVPATERRARLRAIARFQQLTSPVAAKSVEDTAFYRHGTLLSRNEVGADPAQFAITSTQFHAACATRLRRHPNAMLATATHDHKRGEDLRARLAVLSEMPQRWGEAVMRWREAAAPLKPGTGASQGPDATDEYMLYQMLVGAWPFDLQCDDDAGLEQLRLRLAGWQQKAVREAKRRSGWVEPNLVYEESCDEFLRRLLNPRQAPDLLRELHAFVRLLEAPGALNGLAQTLLRLTTPGVPDLYQGCEWWDLSLVDPDNRRPVDFAARAAALEPLPRPDFAGAWREGRVKQALIAALLHHRAAQPRLFAEGRYLPLAIEGPAAEHLLAFARVLGDGEALVVLAPRLPLRLLKGQDSLQVPVERWRGCRVMLPPALAYLRFEHILANGRLTAERGGIDVEQALEQAPLAALAGRL
jgi:(1->4)-alpha-D-glucan 1-alpha-D-glucosylmutase